MEPKDFIAINNNRKVLLSDNYVEYNSINCNIEKKLYLGNKENKVCRFCSKTETDVSFKKEAHVIPQLMGNRNVLSYFECDLCNESFSKYENSLSNMLGPLRTFLGVVRKGKGIPKFKDCNETQISHDKVTNTVEVIINKDLTEVMEEIKQTSIPTKSTFIPLDIYKIFLKIGLSLLKDEDIVNYNMCNAVILDIEHNRIEIPEKSAILMFNRFFPYAFKHPLAILYVRKNDENIKVPKFTLGVYFYNFLVQIFLPFNEDDIKYLDGKEIKAPLIPVFDELLQTEYVREINSIQEDFSSKVNVTIENSTNIHYGSSKKIKIN